jgi:protein phosphatase PTC7
MELGRSPTFLVGGQKQRHILDEFQKREQHFTEEYQKNKPLCFNARAFQRTHPAKMRADRNGRVHTDADATLASPMMVGVADGVSQLEDFGIDASLLPNELLGVCEELAMSQLIPDSDSPEIYRGPVNLLKEAYESTESLGSTTVLLGILDNSTRIHGKLHPMVAVLTIGDCELLMLRRLQGRQSQLQAVFHTEMQRIDGHVQTPLQLARVDDRVDPEFDEDVALEVIERGSAVHCVSTYEGDIVLLGSDGVFDNLFLDELVSICNAYLPPPSPGTFMPIQPAVLADIAQRIVEECHAKTQKAKNGHMPETPIGKGGKMDDTSVVVAEVIEWTEAHSEIWNRVKKQKDWDRMVTCGGTFGHPCRGCAVDDDDIDDYEENPFRTKSRGGYSKGHTHHADYDDDDGKCSIL